ncbi:hypothetical protein [Castellaniella caeni]|uniref:hypothetical protein n=1 Tax=Castellaniella caeni TaxID=266123 RepID=UPI000C9FD4CA|nr:hypothetical protein [Castellaniella caeni]
MAQPPRFQRVKDFGADYPDQTDNQAINNELDAVSQTTDGLRKNLAKIQRDDGELRDGIVTKNALAQPLKQELYDEFSQNVTAAVETAQQAAGDANTAAGAAAVSAANAGAAETAATSAASVATAAAGSAQASQTAAAASESAAHSSAGIASTAAETAAADAVAAVTGSFGTAATHDVAVSPADNTAGRVLVVGAIIPWGQVSETPADYPPAKHVHTLAQIEGLGNAATANITTSTEAPDGGDDGDIWLQV